MGTLDIRSFLATPYPEKAHSKTVDFLDAHSPSLDDLNGLEALLLQAKEHHEAQQSTLIVSVTQINNALSEAQASAEGHLHAAQELSLLRHSLADELTELFAELSPSLNDEGQTMLMNDLETLHRSLKELESVKEYVRIAQYALTLSEAAVQDISSVASVTATSISGYILLQDFVLKVNEACSVTNDDNGQQANLVLFLTSIRDKTWDGIRSVLTSRFDQVAEKIGWPMPINYSSTSTENRTAFEAAFLNLLNLQTIASQNDAGNSHSFTAGIYPIHALVDAINLRFKFHFESSRPTNRIDKPEWYFTHILNVVHEHRLFMDTVVQGFLFSTKYHNIVAWREFVVLLLQLVVKKLKKTVPSLLSRPSLLAHTVYQALEFDAALVDEGFDLQGTSSVIMKWNGVSEVILENQEWFDAWLIGEKRFVEDQYDEIISALDAWLIAEDNSNDGGSPELISTNSARQVKALIEQVSDRYAPLPRCSQRLKFLTAIQLPILESYYSRIALSLDAFETLSSAFVRAVPGALSASLSGKEDTRVTIDTRRLTSGAEGVQRLCKASLSAAYIASSLNTWGEELVFLELWAEIVRDSTLSQIVESNPLLPNFSSAGAEGVPSETIFETMMLKFIKLVTRAQDMIVLQVSAEVESGLKVHHVATQDSTTEDHNPVAQTLLAPIALLSSHLAYLHATFSSKSFTMLYRRIAGRLAEYVLQRQILYRGHFSSREGRMIRAECELLVETCHIAISDSLPGGRQRVEGPWSKVLQAGRLIGATKEDWELVKKMTLMEMNDDDWAQLMLDKTGLNELSIEHVKQVLDRRQD